MEKAFKGYVYIGSLIMKGGRYAVAKATQPLDRESIIGKRSIELLLPICSRTL
jgi:hypothetical protein